MKVKDSKNNNLIYLALVFIVLALVFVFIKPFGTKQNLNLNQNLNQENTVNRQNCLADDCLLVDDLNYPVGELAQSVKDALNEAINDEYKALATYEAVISKFGIVRPFSMIKAAEELHIASLKAIYDKYGITPPVNTLFGTLTAPENLKEACQIGVEAEIANAALYREELIPEVKDYEDITSVFVNLMNASQEKHLTAFERCN